MANFIVSQHAVRGQEVNDHLRYMRQSNINVLSVHKAKQHNISTPKQSNINVLSAHKAMNVLSAHKAKQHKCVISTLGKAT